MSATATLPSISSAALNQISLFTNQREESTDYARVVIAQAGYFAMIPFALVELALSSIISTAASLFYEARDIQTLNTWYESSSTALVWTIYAFFLNMFTPMPTTEQQFNTEVLGINQSNTQGNSAFSNIFRRRGGAFEEYFSGPPAVELRVQALLDPYTLGPSATQHSTIKQRLYNSIPVPTRQERLLIGTEMTQICNNARIGEGIESIVRGYDTEEWKKQFIKMLICTKKEIIRRNDPNEIEVMKESLAEAFGNCVNAKSIEMTELYFNYAAPDLMTDYVAMMTPKESLIWDAENFRSKCASNVIKYYERHNSHGRSAANYWHRQYDTDVFHIAGGLSALDDAYQGYATGSQADNIRNAFTRRAMHPYTIYTLLDRICRQHEIPPTDPEKVKYKLTLDMLNQWILENGKTETALDEDGNFTPEIKIEFLVAMEFLAPRASV